MGISVPLVLPSAFFILFFIEINIIYLFFFTGISVPLVLVGAFFGFRVQPIEHPVCACVRVCVCACVRVCIYIVWGGVGGCGVGLGLGPGLGVGVYIYIIYLYIYTYIHIIDRCGCTQFRATFPTSPSMYRQQ